MGRATGGGFGYCFRLCYCSFYYSGPRGIPRRCEIWRNSYNPSDFATLKLMLSKTHLFTLFWWSDLHLQHKTGFEIVLLTLSSSFSKVLRTSLWIVLKIKSNFFTHTLQKVCTALPEPELLFQYPKSKPPSQVFKTISYFHTIASSSENWLALCRKTNGKTWCRHVKTTSVSYSQTWQTSTPCNKMLWI